MSLSDVIRNSKEFGEKIRTFLPRPAFGLKKQIVAPPLTASYSIIGQAFDYLLRFYLQHRHKKIIIADKAWVADSAVAYILNRIRGTKEKHFFVGYRRDIAVRKIPFAYMLSINHRLAKERHKKFLKTGDVTNELLESCLFLARLDVTARSGMIDSKLGNEDKADIEDLRNLYCALHGDSFSAAERVFLNPTFGYGSSLVYGADVDLVIDDCIIEIKTTKHLTLERRDLNQIIGYYILYLVGGIRGDKTGTPITHLGIYFSRFGILWKFPVVELGEKEKVDEFKEWFIDHVDQFFTSGRDSFRDFLKRQEDKEKKPVTATVGLKPKKTAKKKPQKKAVKAKTKKSTSKKKSVSGRIKS